MKIIAYKLAKNCILTKNQLPDNYIVEYTAVDAVDDPPGDWEYLLEDEFQILLEQSNTEENIATWNASKNIVVDGTLKI